MTRREVACRDGRRTARAAAGIPAAERRRFGLGCPKMYTEHGGAIAMHSAVLGVVLNGCSNAAKMPARTLRLWFNKLASLPLRLLPTSARYCTVAIATLTLTETVKADGENLVA